MERTAKCVSGRVTERDVEVLNSLVAYRYLTTSQLVRLHFTSLQTANRRLRYLVASQYIETFIVPGISERLFFAKKAAYKLFQDEGFSSVNRAKLPQDHHFLRHFLEVSDFRISLEIATRKCEVKLTKFIPEFDYVHGTVGPCSVLREELADQLRPGQKLSHTPDGSFVLERDGNRALFFLEIDRGTEVISRQDKGVMKAMRFYLTYLSSGRYQRFAEMFGNNHFNGFRGLWIVPSIERLENIRKACLELFSASVNAKRFLWLTTHKELEQENLLSVGWVSLDTHDKTIYTIGK